MAAVYTAEMVRYLKVSERTVFYWQKDEHFSGSRGVFDLSEVNAFLARCTHNADSSPPTFDDLRSKRCVLATNEEAIEAFATDRHHLRAFSKRASIVYLQFPGRAGILRYSVQSLNAAVAALEPSVSAHFVLHATGYSAISELKRTPGLKAVYNPWATTSDRVHMGEAGFREHLRGHLPSNVTVDDWIEDRRATNEPLKSAQEAIEVLGLPDRGDVRNNQLLRRLGAHYITNCRNSMLISPLWLRAKFEQEQPFHPDALAKLFDVNKSTVMRWSAEGLLVCSIATHNHDGSDAFLKRSCWLRYLRTHCSDGLQRAMWQFLANRTAVGNPQPLLCTADLVRFSGRGKKGLTAWAKRGGLEGIYLPNGTFRTTEAWARRSGLRLKRR